MKQDINILIYLITLFILITRSSKKGPFKYIRLFPINPLQNGVKQLILTRKNDVLIT